MRLLLVAFALAACHGSAGPATPTNKVPQPDYSAAAADELAFLAIDADFVIGINMIELRRSQMWHSFKPELDKVMQQFQQQFGSCGQDLPSTLEGITMAIKGRPHGQFAGVMVMHGADMARTLDCSVAGAKKKGSTVVVDRGVTIMSNPSTSRTGVAMMVIGSSTLVMQFDEGANHDTLIRALDAGAPLHSSPVFMKMFQNRERGASLWGMANGNAEMFKTFATAGMRPTGIDGTVIVTDRLAIKLRMSMPSPAEATQVKAEFDKLKGQVANFVDRFDATTLGALVSIDIEMTEGQLRGLMAMLGGVMGP